MIVRPKPSHQFYDGVHTLLFLALQHDSAVICSKLALHHLLLPNVVSPVVFSLALSNAGLSTQPQLPRSHHHHPTQCLREIQHCNNLLTDSKEPQENHIPLSEATEYKYYTCISPEPTKCELLGETQTPDSARGNIHYLVYPWFLPSMPQYREWQSSFIYTEATLNDPRQGSYPHEVKRDTTCFWLISPIVLSKIFKLV